MLCSDLGSIKLDRQFAENGRLGLVTCLHLGYLELLHLLMLHYFPNVFPH